MSYNFENLKYTVDSSSIIQQQQQMNYMNSNIKQDPMKRPISPPQRHSNETPLILGQQNSLPTEPSTSVSTTTEKTVKDSENLSDDESLGSDLEDDEELQTENYMICLFEKVKKTKVKRKAFLKDAVLHVNGRDFILKECNTDLVNKI